MVTTPITQRSFRTVYLSMGLWTIFRHAELHTITDSLIATLHLSITKVCGADILSVYCSQNSSWFIQYELRDHKKEKENHQKTKQQKKHKQVKCTDHIYCAESVRQSNQQS